MKKSLRSAAKMQNIVNCRVCVLVAMVGICLVRSDDTFYFLPKPQDKGVVDGKPVVIECNVADTADSHHISIHWNHNNNPLVYDSRRYQKNGNLVITY
ncbi:unnamed protein product, partial [Medioppia subpectinata]